MRNAKSVSGRRANNRRLGPRPTGPPGPAIPTQVDHNAAKFRAANDRGNLPGGVTVLIAGPRHSAS